MITRVTNTSGVGGGATADCSGQTFSTPGPVGAMSATTSDSTQTGFHSGATATASATTTFTETVAGGQLQAIEADITGSASVGAGHVLVGAGGAVPQASCGRSQGGGGYTGTFRVAGASANFDLFGTLSFSAGSGNSILVLQKAVAPFTDVVRRTLTSGSQVLGVQGTLAPGDCKLTISGTAAASGDGPTEAGVDAEVLLLLN